jgi:hypothetical protein
VGAMDSEAKELNARDDSAVASDLRGVWDARVTPFLERHFFVLCTLLILIACVRIVSTYEALSLTTDEPIHLDAGLEYLAKHVYQIDPQHPPLARAFEALGPCFFGARPLTRHDTQPEAVRVIARTGHVDRTIFLMRLGNLPFFLLACGVVCSWAWHWFGKPVAVIATGLFTLLPTVLADGELATTDMALGATVGAAFLVAILWAEKPSWQRGVLFGVFTALAFLSKFTALGYMPCVLGLAMALHMIFRWSGWRGSWQAIRERAATFTLAAGVCAFLIWAAYFFSIGKFDSNYGHFLHLPAPAFLAGIRAAIQHNRGGHGAFLLGEFRYMGWWYYFPVALAVKTPIAFLILTAIGKFASIREKNRLAYLLPLAFSIGILLPALGSSVDIGIRHIEPIWIALCITAAIGVRQLLQMPRAGIIAPIGAAMLVGWLLISVGIHHPDYIAYFNGFAGKQPENILVDSNYDWGQDLRILSKHLHKMGVTEVSLATLDGVLNSVPQRYHYLKNWYGLPNPQAVNMCTPVPGWNVVSTTIQKSYSLWDDSVFYRFDEGRAIPWYEQIAPDQRLGPLLLYNVRPDQKWLPVNCN